LGHHEFVYGLAAHAGDWRKDETDWQAQRLNQPLIAFQSDRHAGSLGKTFSLLSVNNSRVRVLALKKAEESNEIVVRVVELDGRPQRNVRLSFAAPIISAREVNGQELPLGRATVVKGALAADLGPYQLRTFAVKLANSRVRLAAPSSESLDLLYNTSVTSADGEKSSPGFDAAGRAIPAEMLEHGVDYDGVGFHFGGPTAGSPNAVIARGQSIPLPAGRFNRVYILAASADGDQNVTFRIGNQPIDLNIQNWGGFIGQWDDRQWKTKEVTIPPRPVPPGTPPDIAAQLQRPRTRTDQYGEMVGITPGFIKRAPLAWFASHRHNADGANEYYAYSYLFAYAIDVPAGAHTLTLPVNDKIRVLAITAANQRGRLWPVQPLYDTLERK